MLYTNKSVKYYARGNVYGVLIFVLVGDIKIIFLINNFYVSHANDKYLMKELLKYVVR